MKVDIFNTDKKYNIIYADPPWTFKTYSAKGKEKKSAENHYPCMKKQDIQQLPVKSIAADDCVLLMWVTFPCLQEGLELIDLWGFTYKTCGFTWIKQNRKADSLFGGLDIGQGQTPKFAYWQQRASQKECQKAFIRFVWQGSWSTAENHQKSVTVLFSFVVIYRGSNFLHGNMRTVGIAGETKYERTD